MKRLKMAMMSLDKNISLLLFYLLPNITMGMDYHALADAVAVAESNNNTQAVGDNGRAKGAFQMWEIAWTQTNRLRKVEGKKQYSWAYAHDKWVGKEYAIDYLRWCGSVLTKHLNRQPSYWEIYAAYARGPNTFINEHKCRHAELPARTQRAIKIIAARIHEPLPR